jgi:hypothetical protein
MSELKLGDRVEAVRFALDEGLRVWPVFEEGKPNGNVWRVVRVTGQDDDDIEELVRGSLGDVTYEYPEARAGINDNETVAPGTLGTVDLVTDVQVFVHWDNGCRLALTESDVVRVVV